MDSTKKWGKRALICATILGLCGIVVLLSLLFAVLSTPISIIIWTVVFVFLLRGIVNALDRRGINRVFGTIIAYIVMFVVIALVLWFMFSPAFGFAEQVKNMIANIPKYVALIADWAKDMYAQYGHFLKDQRVQNWINDVAASLSAMGGDLATVSANSVIAIGGFFGSTFMALGISLVISFWILVELPAIGRETKKLIPRKYSVDAKMWQVSCTHVMAGFIKGTFLQCFLIGLASGILFWILGAPNCGALGCIVGVLNIIPIFGPILGSIVALVGGIFHSVFAAVVGLIVVSVIQGFVYTFISPRIMSSSCNIHPVLTLLCLTAGGAFGGVMSGPIGSLVGMLLAIPFVAVFKSLFVYYYEKSTGVRLVDEDGFLFKGKPYNVKETHPLYDALEVQPGEEEKVFDKKTVEKVKKEYLAFSKAKLPAKKSTTKKK